MKFRLFLPCLLLLCVLPAFAQDAQFYFERGRKYHDAEDLDAAFSDYNQAIALNPNHDRAYNNRGIIYNDRGELDRAIADYTQAIAINPKLEQAYGNRGNAYREKGEFDRAIADYTQAIAINPKLMMAYYGRGCAYYYKGEFDRAIADYEQAIALNPKLDMAYYYRGLIYADKGELDRAIADFTQALTIDPKYLAVYYVRGIAYYYKGELDRAIADFTQAISLNPKLEQAYTNRGNAYKDKGEMDRAIADYTQAIALNTKNMDAYTKRGIAYSNKGELDKAIADFTQAIAIDPKYAAAYYSRGLTYQYKNELDRAIADYTQAIALNPKLEQAYNNRGAAYKDKGEFDRAIADYTQAIALNPKLEQAYTNRGAVYRNKGELDRAIADYTQAIALNPKNADAYNNRGNAYKDKGELDRAIADYTQAIAINPKDEIAYNNRGIAFYDKGELDRAITDYTQAIALNTKYANAYNSRGNAYKDKDELDRAIADYTQAIALNPVNEDAYNNRGDAYYIKGELDRAIADYTQAIAINPKFNGAYSNRGAVYTAKGELDRAITDFTQAIALNPEFEMAYTNRGNVYAAKGEPDRAIADYNQAILAADASANILNIFFWSWQFAGTLYKDYPFLGAALDKNVLDRRRANVAREALSLSIAKADKARAGLGSRGAALMAGLVYQYYASLDFEARFGSAERAFAVSEGLRSRSFLEQMGTEAALRLPGIAPSDAKRVRELTETIGSLQEMLGKLNPQFQQERYAEAGLALTRAEEELAALDKRITEKIPRYASLRNPKTAALGEAKTFCGDDTAILEFAIWDYSVEFTPPATSAGQSSFKERPSINSYCLVITRNGLTPVTLDNSFDYAGTVNTLISKIHHKDAWGGIQLLPEKEFEQERNALYAALIKPVLDRGLIPAGVKRLLIVPDGELAFLPFDILRENPNSPELGITFRLSMSPSVSVSIMAAQQGSPGAGLVLAFGGAWYDKGKSAAERTRGVKMLAAEETGQTAQGFDAAGEYYKSKLAWADLPGTETEVKAIEKIASQSMVFLGRETNERKIKELSANGTLERIPVLHFACHGYFNGARPELSSVVFSEVSGLLTDSPEDGYLTVAEAALLRLNARTVILSACETGRGGLKRGDGMVGLVRSFLTAGARSAGVSLWPISDDATVEFMESVYRRTLREGKSFREAYYEVKQEFRKGEWAHPFYHAAFVLYE